MILNLYFLKAELPEEERLPVLTEELKTKVDGERLARAERIKAPAEKYRSLCAGLVIQRALKDLDAGVTAVMEVFTMRSMLDSVERPRETAYRYNRNGKPFFADREVYFSLSHSGEYIFLGVSDIPIGVDIQLTEAQDFDRLAGRFFAKEEGDQILLQPEPGKKKKLFYEYWTFKEAYAKCRGKTLAEVVDQSCADYEDAVVKAMPAPYGYAAAMCLAKSNISDALQ